MSPRAWIMVLGLVSATSAITVDAADKPAAPAAAATSAAAPAAQDAVKDNNDPRVALAKKIPGGAKPEELRASPIPGVYELARGTEIAYVSDDGKYAIAGDLFELATDRNITETTRRAERVKMISAVPESQMVVFSPKEAPKYTISVFTDVDCTYCRKLHSQIAEYNRLGIKVRYLSFPRTGPDTESWAKAEAVWCSANRGEALTRAKRGEEISKPKSCNSPVAKEYQLGEDVGVRGTPAIVLENGEMLPGYLPPAQLAAHLKGKDKDTKGS